ncbi:2_t:CDS:10 [Entrophospora sp. SA101]|nr:2_t:CDS:10 [Entrophospora sp. SA101]
MSSVPSVQQITSKEILIKKANSGTSIPANYSTTPSGTIYSNTPGGTKIIYDRNTLLNLANSPLAKTPTKLAYIPGVTIPQTTDQDSSEKNDSNNNKKLNRVAGHLAPPNSNYPGFKNILVDSNQNGNISSGSESGDEENTPDKGVAFVTYKSPLNAEFAKEAMTNQSLDHNEILNAEALAVQAIQKSLPVEFSLGGHEYFNKKPRITTTTDIDSNQDFYGLEGYENPYGIINTNATTINDNASSTVSTMVETILPTTTTATTVVYNEQQQQPLLALDSTKIDNDYYNNNYDSRGFNSSINSRQTNEVYNDKKLDKKENKSALAGLADYGSSDDDDDDDNEEEENGKEEVVIESANNPVRYYYQRHTHLFQNPKTDLSKLDPILDVEKPFITPPSLPTYRSSSTIVSPEAESDDTDILAALTGLTAQEIRALQKKVLIVKRVVNQTSKGRIFKAATSVRKATNQAIKNLQYFHRYNDRTIYHEIQYKFHSTKLKLMVRPPAAKVLGSRNGMNVVKATFQALETQKLPEDLAKTRGKKVVDLYRTYYA